MRLCLKSSNCGAAAPRCGGGDDFYCTYERENSQRHLEASKLNWSMRGVGRKDREGKKRERGRGEGKRVKRGPGAKLASYVGVREAGEEN